MGAVELHLMGDLDYAATGVPSANGILRFHPAGEMVTIDCRENRPSAMPLWARRILQEELPKAARCNSCGELASEALRPCGCGQRRFRLERKAWRTIEERLIAYMGRTRKKASRRWNEAFLPGYCSQEDLEEIVRIQRGECYFCAAPLGDKGRRRAWHADHLLPVTRRNSTNWPRNIVAVCPRCNSRRGDGTSATIWRILAQEKGTRYVQHRRAQAHKFDAQRRILDMKRRAWIKDALRSAENTCREELRKIERGGAQSEIATIGGDLYAHIGLLTIGLPGAFATRLALWPESRRRSFFRNVIELAGDAGALQVEPL
jgi:5-methylcytosine-specific restriction endonuclease McrA